MPPKDKIVKPEERSGEAAPSTAAMLGPQMPTQESPVTFERWFKIRGKERKFKPHWAAGMQAYTDTNVPRPMPEWDNIFSKY